MTKVTRYDLIAGDIQPFEDGDYVTHSDYVSLLEEKKYRDAINLKIKQRLNDQVGHLLQQLREHLSNETQLMYQIYNYQSRLFVESNREEFIHQIASQIGRGTFYEDAERIYNLLVKSEDEVWR